MFTTGHIVLAAGALTEAWERRQISGPYYPSARLNMSLAEMLLWAREDPQRWNSGMLWAGLGDTLNAVGVPVVRGDFADYYAYYKWRRLDELNDPRRAEIVRPFLDSVYEEIICPQALNDINLEDYL